jgi:predicted transcriptional regulator
MQDVIRRLRLQARSFSRGKSPRATRYSKAFQVEAIAAARKRRVEGIAVARIARELGLTTQTLTRWLGSSPRAALRPVRVVAASRPVAHTTTKLVLVAPGGFRVEGLDTEALAQILRSLA